MAKSNRISMSVIRRLPRYYRFLTELHSEGVLKISSTNLASIMNVTASQVRQDLNCFGGFGHQGYGYCVEDLKNEIENILGLNNNYQAVLLGAGNLGKAVARHINFSERGFQLTAIFDRDPEKIGTELGGIIIRNDNEIYDYCRQNKTDAVFLCIPKNSVENVIDKLYELGIRNFWNFSHYDIAKVYPDTVVENVHMSDSLMTLCYRINDSQKEN